MNMLVGVWHEIDWGPHWARDACFGFSVYCLVRAIMSAWLLSRRRAKGAR